MLEKIRQLPDLHSRASSQVQDGEPAGMTVCPSTEAQVHVFPRIRVVSVNQCSGYSSDSLPKAVDINRVQLFGHQPGELQTSLNGSEFATSHAVFNNKNEYRFGFQK
ncbi:hypothetical protein E4K72_02950 [Oxalobacteraceae bacterium OM1]|nr:hypothetical protein E4K72_02950 [Oxalobacteraceae bacterium OM1]